MLVYSADSSWQTLDRTDSEFESLLQEDDTPNRGAQRARSSNSRKQKHLLAQVILSYLNRRTRKAFDGSFRLASINGSLSE